MRGYGAGNHGGARRRMGIALVAAAVAAVAVPVGPALAQAICSGPHASPAKPTTGGLTTEPPGSGWLQLSLFHHDTREQYGPEGDTRSFLTDARAVTTTLFATAAVGLVHGAEAMVQLPVHRLQFTDGSGRRQRTGFGDPRVYLRLAPPLVGLPPVPVAVRAGVKFSGSEFPVDAEVLPLTEGQRDWELALEVGRSFAAAPLYVRGWAGYRWREENRTAARDPGNERFAYLAVGGPAGRFHWELAAEGLSGNAPTSQGLRLRNSRRSLVQLFPTLGVPVGGARFELGGRVPVQGRNLPAGSAFSVGYSTSWSWR